MDGKTENRIEQVACIATAAILVIGCYVVIRPFLSALLWASILCFSTWPLYKWLETRLKGRSTLAATTMTVLIALVLLAPFVAVGFNMADNVAKFVSTVREALHEGVPDPPAWVAQIPWIGNWAEDYWQELAHNPEKLTEELRSFFDTWKGRLANFGADVGRGIFQLSLSVFIAFFLYRDGAAVAEKVSGAAQRITGDRTQQLLGVVGGTVKGVVYGLLGTALAQGILAGIGFWIAGVPAPFLLGLLTFFLSLVPMGPPLVWIPAAVWLLYTGHVGWAIFLAIWGTALVSSVDNFLKPYLISRGSKLPFVLVFMGVLGGVVAFGFIGIFLGPTLLAVAYSVLQEWTGAKPAQKKSEKKAEKSKPPAEAKLQKPFTEGRQ